MTRSALARLEFGGKLTLGPLPPQKRALVSEVGALIISCGWPWLSDKHPLARIAHNTLF